jgi:hypothetical protein
MSSASPAASAWKTVCGDGLDVQRAAKGDGPHRAVEAMWTAFTIPFVLVAIVVATGPVIYMTYHSFKHGHVASPPDHARALVPKEAKDPQTFGWATCPECKAIVTDALEHGIAVHLFAET